MRAAMINIARVSNSLHESYMNHIEMYDMIMDGVVSLIYLNHMLHPLSTKLMLGGMVSS